MASDVSSGCNELFDNFDEKEEGEISLEDVSSSEEGQPAYGYEGRNSQCPHCLSTQQCTAWCTRLFRQRGQSKRDAVQGKENRRYTKDYSSAGTKHTTAKLQEKNDDLLPISSDSDMEIVGLTDNTKQMIIHSASKAKVKKKKKKKKGGLPGPAFTIDDIVSSVNDDTNYEVSLPKQENFSTKGNHLPRSHHRDSSSIHKSSRTRETRVLSRSPPRRYRSPPLVQLPFKKSHSPPVHSRPQPLRRSPRRHRSPRRFSYHSPVRTNREKVLESPPISPSDFDNFEDAKLRAKLLRKVKELDAMGANSPDMNFDKNKDRASSLKDKLSNMLKTEKADNNENLTNYSDERSKLRDIKEPDDDEDLALLRQKALETKHKKSSKEHDKRSHNDEDTDEEELRMTALRSAVLKKHQNRIERGLKLGINKKYANSRSESPFGQSFLEALPGEDSNDFQSPHASPGLNDSMHTEDMDLDTDIEREKEKLPYSPTDNITLNIPMDTELLGIQPSDVSFISVNETNCTFNNMSIKEDYTDLHTRIIENKSYLPSSYYMDMSNTDTLTSTNVPYVMNTAKATQQISNIPSNISSIPIPQNPPQNIQTNNNVSLKTDISLTQERPYSPTDTPLYDPDLSRSLPQFNYSNTFNPVNNSVQLAIAKNNSMHCALDTMSHLSSHLNLELPKTENNVMENRNSSIVENFSMCPDIAPLPFPIERPVSSNESLITIDELPDTDKDESPIKDSFNAQNVVLSTPNNVPHEVIQEPLYMQGVPDVTKDVNKIPTLINRTLVPMSILKTNKQLQQVMPVRKNETCIEPTFKTAEMQPVSIESEINNELSAAFKPIRLASTPKSQSLLTTSVISDSSTSTTAESKKIENKPVKDKNQSTSSENSKTNNDTISKDSVNNIKKRNAKRNSRHRNSVGAQINKKTESLNNKEKGKSSNNSKQNTSKVNKIQDLTQLHDNKYNKKQEKSLVSKSVSDTSRNLIDSTSVSDNINKKRKRDDLSDNNQEAPQNKEQESRRESVDDDEEMLRATLLASLAKRSKPSDVNVSATTATTSNINTETLTYTSDTQKSLKSDTTIASNKSSTSSHIQSNNNTNIKIPTINNIPNKSVNHVVNENAIASSLLSAKKKSNTAIKGPPKKIIKKVSIPASTKVVNNAKKYQNTIVQKRLHLQKAATLYNVQKQVENKFVANIRNNENKWTANPKPSLLPEPQRIVIRLGSDTDSDSEPETQETCTPVSSSVKPLQHPTMTIPTKEFEKNVEKFLREERKKQESAAAAAKPSSNSSSSTPQAKNIGQKTILQTQDSSNLDTPLAVRRHLPASQQEEYRRLKQQILERERLRKPTQSNNSVQSAKKQTSQVPNVQSNTGTLNQTSPSKNQSTSAHMLFNKDSTKNTSPTDIHNAKELPTKPAISNATNHANNVVVLQTDGTKKLVTNFSISVPNRCSSNQENTQKTSVNESSQKVALDNSTKQPTKPIASLKILTKDELNDKCVQIQVNQESRGRVVTINNKENLNVNINQTENLLENNTVTNERTGTNIVPTQVMEKLGENVNNNKEMIDNESLETTESRSSTLQHSTNKDISLSSTVEKNQIDSLNSSKPSSTWDDKNNIRVITAEVDTLLTFTQVEQQRQLKDHENKLIAKRYAILKDLAEMSDNVQRWDTERDLQMSLVAEVQRLKEQLRIAEEKLQMQRVRINEIGPKVKNANVKINNECRECFKLIKMCTLLGEKLNGQDYKVPDTGAELLQTKLKEVAISARQLSKKKIQSVSENSPLLTSPTKSSPLVLKTELIEEPTLPLENDVKIDEINCVEVPDNSLQNTDNSLHAVIISQDTASSKNNVEENISLNAYNNEQSISEQNNSTMMEQPESYSTPVSSNQKITCNEPISLTAGDEQSKDEEIECEEIQVEAHIDHEEEKPDVEMLQQDHEFTSKRSVEPYISILSHLKEPRNTNPNGVLCPYELMGTCCDAECQFVHQSNHTQ